MSLSHEANNTMQGFVILNLSGKRRARQSRYCRKLLQILSKIPDGMALFDWLPHIEERLVALVHGQLTLG